MELPQRPRKRARVACTWCHERKVRCDVSIRGSPCTNCQLDGHQCNLRPTANKGREVGYRFPSRDAGGPAAVTHQPSWTGPMLSTETLPSNSTAVCRPMDTMNQNAFTKDAGQGSRFCIEEVLGFTPQVPRNVLNTHDDSPPPRGSSVIFSFHRFLELTDLSALPTEDVKYLEMKGCLHVPSGTLLDELVRQYFKHVHPCLPVINEAEFWNLYNDRIDHQTQQNTRISLFTFQAMLFASCGFVPSSLLKSVGYPDRRTARNMMYNRAKLLFDLKAETDTLSKAQGAILLTYQSSMDVPQAGTYWLTVAIHNAMLVDAHLYHNLRRDDPARVPKKRLWWSVLLRDRILPLGLRRHLQISPDQFDLNIDCMDESDLDDEIQKSQVYSVGTKRSLALILNLQCRLALILTSVIITVYAPNSFTQPKKATEQEFMESLSDINNIKLSLREWYDDATKALSPITCSDGVHDSVILYSDMMYMYYDAARAALCHFEAFTVEAHQEFTHSTRHKRLEDIKHELEDAAFGTTKRVQHLLSRGVARNVPISAVAYTAFPLVLIALDAKFSESSSECAARKNLFRYYAQIMELYRTRYDGSDAVAVYIQQVLQLVEAEKLRITLHGDKSDTTDLVSTKGTKNWSDIFIRHPRFYLRISLTLDLAISRGQYPRETDLPPLVRELPMRGQRRAASDMLLEDSPPEEPPASLENSNTNNLLQPQPHAEEPGASKQQFISQRAPPQQTDLWLQPPSAMGAEDGFGSVPPSANRENFSDVVPQSLFTKSPPDQDEEQFFQQPQQSQQITHPNQQPPQHGHTLQQPQPQRPPLDEVNLDFLDLRDPHFATAEGAAAGGGSSDTGLEGYIVGTSQPADPAAAVGGDPNWSSSILDEILNAISA